MIKHIFLLSFIVLFLLGCYHENKVNPDKPETFLSNEEMTEIITDIQLAEGIIVHNRSVRTNMDNEYKDSVYAQIFRHYGITATIFKENVNYYNSDPAIMEDIYEEVLAKLSRMQSQVEMEAEEVAKTEAKKEAALKEKERDMSSDTLK